MIGMETDEFPIFTIAASEECMQNGTDHQQKPKIESSQNIQ
jgi:hypothetical protein